MIQFLTLDDVIELHGDAIAEYGGEHGVRDLGLLESAIAQPMAMFGGEHLHANLAEMAAAYLFHLVMNHPFIDGNKRVVAYAAGVFLDVNGTELTCDNDSFEELVLSIARGEVDKAEVIAFFRKHVRPRD